MALILYSLYICCICSVAMILELIIHTKNRNVHMYTRADFQEHLERDVEDIRVYTRVITKLSHSVYFPITCLFPPNHPLKLLYKNGLCNFLV